MNDEPITIGQDYAELIAGGANVFQASGAKIFNMDAGTLSDASPAQIGRIVNGITITAAMVQENQQLLDDIGAYCRAHGISIDVEAQLDNPPSQDWTYQWLNPAVAADLPITAVENDDEDAVSVPDTPANVAAVAENMVSIVKRIAADYPTVQIGQWEGGNPLSATADFLTGYDTAADAAGLPSISFVVADTSWNTPWVTSPSSWQTWLVGLSNLIQSDHMQLEVCLDGIDTDASDLQWTAQTEQHAAMLSALSLPVSTLLIRTWGEYPNNVLPVNEPTTIGNEAAEIAATYSLYQSEDITVQGPVTISAPSQAIVILGSTTAMSLVSLQWATADVTAGTRVALVLMDGTGDLSASCVLGGTVSGAGTNELILNGTSVEVAAELKTLTVTETASGPDSLDIEAFGANGRLNDAQTSIVALAGSPGTSTQSYNFSPTSAQPWTSASVSINSSGTIISENFAWNSTDQNTAGQYLLIKTDSIHEPLAESGVAVVNGTGDEPLADPSPNTSASLPFSLSSYNADAFNPANQLSAINVLSTVMIYGSNGVLQTTTDQLAPNNPTAMTIDGALQNYLSTGGTQITQFNTGSNPNWQSGWSTTLGSVTTTYGSNGQVLEQVFQGGTSQPDFVVDNVFDPYTGHLWEQIETGTPPAQYSNFVTGDEYITEFNTGDNPNWDSNDWGSNARVTVTWQDYYAIGVSLSAPAPSMIAPAETLPSTSLTIDGAAASQATSDISSLSPLSSVVVTDPNAGQTDTVTVSLSAAVNGTLSNLDGGSYNATTGVYTDTGSAAAVTAALDGLVFTPTSHQVAPGETVSTSFTITDTDGPNATGTTTTVVATAIPVPGFTALDTTTGQIAPSAVEAYSGPVSGLQDEYINITTDSLNIIAHTPNWFIHSGGGNDAIAVSSGTNVLDGGTGSNFLTGGSGADTFFVDDRAATADIWSTVNNFHAGDAATIWGVTQQDFALTWVDGQGAAGYTGLTLHATAAGEPTASLTLVGYSQADLSDGRLSVCFGTECSSAYMSIQGNG